MSVQLTDQTTAEYYKATTVSEKEHGTSNGWICLGLNGTRGRSPWYCAAADAVRRLLTLRAYERLTVCEHRVMSKWRYWWSQPITTRNSQTSRQHCFPWFQKLVHMLQNSRTDRSTSPSNGARLHLIRPTAHVSR